MIDKQDSLLTERELDEIIIRAKGSLNAVAVYVREAQLAKTEPIIRKDEREKLGKWLNDHSACGHHKGGLYEPVRPEHIATLLKGQALKETPGVFRGMTETMFINPETD